MGYFSVTFFTFCCKKMFFLEKILEIFDSKMDPMPIAGDGRAHTEGIVVSKSFVTEINRLRRPGQIVWNFSAVRQQIETVKTMAHALTGVFYEAFLGCPQLKKVRCGSFRNICGFSRMEKALGNLAVSFQRFLGSFTGVKRVLLQINAKLHRPDGANKPHSTMGNGNVQIIVTGKIRLSGR